MPLLLVGGYALRQSLRAPEMRRRWHAARLGWPWIGDVELKFQTASFTRTLAMLLEAGVPVVPALQIARAAVANVSLGERIGEAVTTVSEGGAVASALSGTVPPMAVHMLAVGEESGRLGELCGRVADTCHGEVRRALRTAVSMIEPVMILVFGALVGFVALAMLQAIYSINTSGF